jgi:hypothetical protein
VELLDKRYHASLDLFHPSAEKLVTTHKL